MDIKQKELVLSDSAKLFGQQTNIKVKNFKILELLK